MTTMDYKQEAERIIKLFRPFSDATSQGRRGGIYDIEKELMSAKACAAICVQEIIKNLPYDEDDYKAGHDHWNKVLEHIKQL